eukprot:Gb_26828 [translate_table: standard]
MPKEFMEQIQRRSSGLYGIAHVRGDSPVAVHNPHGFVLKRQKLYGSLFSTCLLGKPTMVSSDAEINKFVLQNEGRLFISCYPDSMRKLLGKWTISEVQGDLHKKMRSAALSIMSSTALNSDFIAHIEQCLLARMKRWDDQIVDVHLEAQEITFSIIANRVLGLSPGKKIENLKGEFNIWKKGLVSFPLNVPGTPYANSFKARKNILTQIRHILEEKERVSGPNSDLHHQNMLIPKFLENEENRFHFTPEQILDFILVLLYAGHEATSHTMAMAVKLISKHPKALQQLKEEHEAIQQKKKENEMLTSEDCKSMIFRRQVINETLRLESISIAVIRQAIQDVRVEGFTIPKGWTTLVYMQGPHVDEKYHPDPLSFNPWRWQENERSYAPLTPFGGGIRFCTGNELAMLEISIFLHHLVTQYRWDLVEDSKIRWLGSAFKAPTSVKIHPRYLKAI